jgi:TonB-linked SusC/RagA family outer membrane protein
MNHGFLIKTQMKTLLWIVAALGMTLASDAWAQQQGTILGTVTDAQSGETIPGVNVIIAGTQQGGVSDADGSYRISDVEPGTYDVQASFIGYATNTVAGVSVPAGETVEVNIELEESAVFLDDVVVTALGVEREERSLTYGTQNVSAAELAEARELNVASSLSGKVAGLSVNQAGTGLGGATRLILRGNRSINGNSQPLFVVDGVPIRGDISTLNPDNIQEISVLKGPNAAALYGSAAQNGAIVVTTMRARSGQVSASFSQNFMIQDPILLTDYQNTYGQGSAGQYNPGSEFSWGPQMNGQMVAFWSPDPALAGTEYAFTPQPDNVKEAFQTGYSSATNVMASVGAERVQGIFSYSYTNATGTVPSNNLERHNVQVRATSQPAAGLALDGKLAYARQTIDNELATGESFTNPIRHVYRLPRNIRTEDAELFEYFDSTGVRRQHYWNPGSNGGANPYWTEHRNLTTNTRDRVMVLGSATYDFTDFLSLMVRGSYDGEAGDSETKLYNDTYIVADNGRYLISKSNAFVMNGDFLLSYRQDLSRDFSFDANFGGNLLRQRNTAMFSNTGPALTVPNFFTISNTQNVISTQSVGSPVDVHSLYGFGQVNWRDAVYLDLTGRNDWSSTLPEENRSYFYPSVGLSAIVSELIPSLSGALSFARVRASWAKVGNSAPPFMLQRTASFTAGGNNGFLQLSGVLPNENLKPEETVSTEVGLDLRFFQGRLGMDATAYTTSTQNQLFTVALPVGSGASSFFTNGGDVVNKGLELMLTSTPIRTGDFTWSVDVNFAMNRNEVVKISEERPSLTIATDFLRAFRIEEGEEYGNVYSRGFDRDDQGRVRIGSNGMPLITDGLNVKVANYNPDWLGGIQTSLTYKNLSVSALIDHRQGGSIASLTNAILYADGATVQTLDGREGGLIFGENLFPGETAVLDGTDTPNNIEIDAETFWRGVGGRNAPVGEAFVVDATNTRLRELTIGYSVPPSLFGGTPISIFKVSLVGRNLFFIHRASKNLDPDLMIGTFNSAEGFDSFAPPSTRSYGLNLMIQY